MATLDLAGIITRVCTDLKEKFASIDSLAQKQDKLVSGTNIKTLNGNSLLGSGNVSIPVGYELRTNEISMTASDSCGGSRIWFTSADGTKMVPINTSTSSSATTTKTLNTRPIDPFGRIIYYSYAGHANSSLSTSVQWDQCSVAIGFSYVKTLTQKLPVYLKCTPQSDGSAVMADVVQALPSTNDGYIYIFLGVAYSSGFMELQIHHPVYYHDGTGIRLWEGAESGSGGGGSSAYVIGMTLSGTTVSNVTYPTGESATTIATAVMDDPSTRVVFSIDVGDNHGVMNCTPCSLQADAYPAYGDEATSIYAVMPMWYEDRGGDRETYLLRLMLYGGNWSAQTRTTI